MEQDHTYLARAAAFRNAFPTMYDVRNILEYSDKGKDAIANYYALGPLYVEGHVNIPLSTQFEAVVIVLSKMTMIEEFVRDKTSQEILITNLEAESYSNFIDDAKIHSTNQDYQGVLSYFNSLLGDIKGKSIEDVHAYFED